MAAFPFFTQGRARRTQAADRRQRLHRSTSAARSCKDKTHFFGGYEHTERDLSGLQRHHDHAGQPGGARPHRAAPTCRAASTPSSPSARSITSSTRPTACRCATCSSTTSSPPTSAAASLSVQRATDFTDRQHSTGAQLVSTIGADDAERVARAVRDARAEPRAERAVGHRPGDQHHRRRQLRRPDRRRSPTPASASRRT